MIPSPSTDYTDQEALLLGATPAVRATFLPHLWPNGVDADGTFAHCSYVAPDRIQADYEGFSGGSWTSEVLTSNLQIPTSPAVITWDWNYLGFDALLYWRAATNTTDLAAAAWVLVNQGDTLDILPFYQFKLTLEGYRCWTANSVGEANDFTAYAVPAAGNALDSYAAPVNVPGDVLTYIEALQLLGEFAVVSDIERAGTVTMEAPVDCSDLVAGAHDGLTLNNRQGSFTWNGTNYVWTPAPLYSPNKSSFLFAGRPDWYGNGASGDGTQLRIELGWNLGGFLGAPFFGGPLFQQQYTEFITLFLGKIDKWGPVTREVDQDGVQSPNTVEVAAKDYILDCLQKRICLPAADGTPQPLTMGEYLCKADPIFGWSPAPLLKSAYFAEGNYNELDHVVALGGGVFSLIAPGPTATRAFQTQTTGANQSAYGTISLPYSGELFATGTMTFAAVPVTIANLNMTFMQAIDTTGAADFAISVDNTGALYSSLGGQSQFNVLPYIGVPLSFALWLSPTNPGYACLWINGDEVLTYRSNLSGNHPIEFRFGADTAGIAENWTIQFENIEIRSKYYFDAFRVTGAPFTGIGPVYIDNVAQPDSKSVGSYVQTLTRYPEYGMVQFTSTDPEFKPTGDVLLRVIENAGGRHALYMLETLIGLAGLTSLINTAALAAAYLAVPNDIIHARFEGGGNEKFGLKDFASLGITVGECIKEICSRMLYWFFSDSGEIKIVPYTGIAPTSPAMAFIASNMHAANQNFDLGKSSAFVSVIYGWYKRNPTLFYLAGDATAGAQGTGLDFSVESPVFCESLPVVKAKADLLLIFLSAQERIDPVKTKRLQAARLELMEVISVDDALLNDVLKNYRVSRKEVVLDPPREVALQPISYLGES